MPQRILAGQSDLGGEEVRQDYRNEVGYTRNEHHHLISLCTTTGVQPGGEGFVLEPNGWCDERDPKQQRGDCGCMGK